jgi:hypothetical protein
MAIGYMLMRVCLGTILIHQQSLSSTLLQLSLKNVSACFQSLFQQVNEDKKKHIQYNEIIGRWDDPPDLFPVSMFSKFKHFYSLADIHEASLILQGAINTCGNNNDPATLIGMINTVTQNIQNDFHLVVRGLILYLLGQQSERPNDAPRATLPGLIDSLFTHFFQQWRHRFACDTSTDDNVFALLQNLDDTIRSCVDVPSTSLPPMGTMDDNNNDTILSKAILSQKIIGHIINDYIPVNYLRFNLLIMCPTCSVSAAIASTIRHIKDGHPLPPHTIANRFDEIHNLWKASICGRLIVTPAIQEMHHRALHDCMQSIVCALSKKEISYNGERLFLVQELARQLKCEYIPGSLFAHLKNLGRILMHPRTIIDDEIYDKWMGFIGNSADLLPGRETLFGVINLIAQFIIPSGTSVESLKEAISLIGKRNDLYEIRQGERTLYGFLNRLFLLNFDFIPSMHRAISDVASHLDDAYLPLLMRTDRLFLDIQSIIDARQFDWADVIFESLHEEFPTFLEYLQQYVHESIPTGAHKAFWSDFEANGALNRMINAVRGGGIRRILSEPNARTLEWYLGQINGLAKNSRTKDTSLIQLIGVPSSSYLRQTLTLNDRFRYLKEILWNIATFENTSQEWYATVNDLLALFKALYTHVSQLSIGNNLQLALQVLGEENAKPGMDSVFSIIKQLFYNSSSVLFEFILDKYRASKFGLSVETSRSLAGRLQRLKAFLTETETEKQTLDITTEFDLIGEVEHRATIPSVFGRLAACEDALLQMWNKSYYIPIYQVLSLAAHFYEITHKIMYEITHKIMEDGWTADTLALIGTPTSSIDDLSLFGTLNHVIASCLTAPLGHNVQYIAEMMPHLVKQIAEHPAMSADDRIAVLRMIISHGELQDLFPNASLIEEDLLPDDWPLAVLEQKISNFFYPVAGFFRFYQAEQFWDIGHKLSDSLDEICSYLTKTKDQFNPVASSPNPSIAPTVLSKLGNPRDIADWKGHEPASAFGLSNRFGVRLHVTYSTLRNWVDDPHFLECFDFLNKLKEKFYPGDCGLYYLTDGLNQIDHSIGTISAAVQFITTNNATIAGDKNTLLAKIECDLQKIGKTNSSIARVLPHALGTHFHEILRCVDISEYIADAIDEFAELGKDVVALVPAEVLAGPPVYTKQPVERFDCVTLQTVLNSLADNVRSLATFGIPWGDDLIANDADILNTWEWIARIKMAVQCLFPQSIKHDLRLHAEKHRKLHCLSCSVPAIQFERIYENLQEVSTNLSYLSAAFASHIENAPQKKLFALLTDGGTPEEMAQYAETASLEDKVTQMEQFLTKIMQVVGIAFRELPLSK